MAPSQFKPQPAEGTSPPEFALRVLDWFDRHGRHDLPWQQDPSPYRVWVSEIMLQQTQVGTVIPFYQRFMARFPDVQSLALADIDQVLHLWTGLGYYARARNLHRAAQVIVNDYDGEFPVEIEALKSLPGIGRSTAGAIAALAMDSRAPILDGNVKRVLTRYHAIAGWPEQSKVKSRLWDLADSLTPQQRVADYTQAMMDLGATVCTRSRPACDSCPLHTDCHAYCSDNVADYPGKKPRKPLPVKAVRMLIIHNGKDEVLLEKRPARGIWGGLYSFPESPPAERGTESTGSPDTRPVLPQSLTVGKARELPSMRHSFTHYHLDITPVLTRAHKQSHGVADSDRWLWYPLDGSLEVGLSAPVKKLLAQMPEEI